MKENPFSPCRKGTMEERKKNMSQLYEKKQALRKELQEARKSLSQEYQNQADEAIAQALLALPSCAKAQTIFCYVSMKGEPATLAILESLLEAGKRVAVPLCIGPGVMEAIEIHSLEDLRPGAYGILEPPAATEDMPALEPEAFDFAVIPCVSCGKDGKRLGHGAGYYDRFLECCRATTCALCYEELLRENIPTAAHDRAMDMVLTEKDLYGRQG